MASIAYNSEITVTVADQIETAQKRLDQLAHSDSKDEGPQPFVTALNEGLKETDRAVAMEGALVGVTTGLSDLDGVTGGLLHGELCIVAGRPGMGKSALALHIAIAAAQAGHVVAFFSLEMTRSETGRRALSSKTGIPYNDMRRGVVDGTGMRNISAAAQQLVSLPLIIDESARLSTAALKARVRRIRHEHGLGLVVIDYLQLIRPDDRYKGNRVHEVSEISADLKALAKEMSVPVLVLSQLNRTTELRDNKRPQLSDLRESGAIEQDADLVIFAYRDEYYLERSEPPAGTPEHTEWADKMSAARNTMELILAKNRHGPTVTKTIYANMSTSAFGDLRRGGPCARALGTSATRATSFRERCGCRSRRRAPFQWCSTLSTTAGALSLMIRSGLLGCVVARLASGKRSRASLSSLGKLSLSMGKFTTPELITNSTAGGQTESTSAKNR